MIEKAIPGKTDAQALVERKIVRSEEFPSDPKERLAAVLAGFANREAKAVTLLLLRDYPKGGQDLWQEFLEVTDNRWMIGWNGPKGYCRDSLIPVGMVAEELFLSMGTLEFTLGYTTTEAGEHYGKPIAAFLLRKAVEYGYSFFPIFGSTCSTGASRAPSNRAKILELLVQNPVHLRTADITSLLGFEERTLAGQHLRALDKAGLISYSAVGAEESGYASFQWRPGKKLKEEVIDLGHYPLLTRDIARILASKGEPMNREDLQKALPKSFRGKIRSLSNISEVLNCLLHQGFAIARFRGEKHSEIKLLEKGERFYQEVIWPIKEALSDGPGLAEMRALMTGWPNFAPEAVRLYKEVSPHAQGKSRAVWQRKIFGLLELRPDGLRPKEISDSLSDLSHPRAISLLNEFFRDGLVRKRKEGRAVYYCLPTLSQSS